MNTTAPVRLVAAREIRERTRAKAFRISTLVVVVVVAGAIIVPAELAGGTTTWRIGLSGQAPAGLADALRRAGPTLKVRVRVRDVPADRVNAVVRDRAVDAVVVDGSRLVVLDKVSDRLLLVVSGVTRAVRLADTLGGAGVGPADIARLLDTRPLPVQRVKHADPARRANESTAVGGMVLLYVALAFGGYAVASGVVEEKTSRVAEVLLAAVRPAELLGGKVLGVGVVSLLQVLAAGAAALGAGLVVGSFGLPHGTLLTGASLVMWFLLGYGLYSSLFAAAASLVSRQEDVQTVTTPMTIVLLVGYLGAFAVSGVPDSPLARIASFLPPLAPMIMPVRAAAGSVSPWEVPLAMALTIAATVAVVRLAGRIYAGGLLRAGARLKVRDALRAEPAGSGRPR